MALSTIRSRFNRSLYLRLAALILSIISLIMVASIIPPLNNDENYYADGMESLFAGLVLGGNCWTIIHNSILLGIGLGGITYHPGVDIAFDLLGWGLNWAMGILAFMWSSDMYYVDYQCNSSWSGYDAEECATATKLTGIQMTGGLICIIVGTMHLIHFIQACIETHHRRVSHDRARFMELGGMNKA